MSTTIVAGSDMSWCLTTGTENGHGAVDVDRERSSWCTSGTERKLISPSEPFRLNLCTSLSWPVPIGNRATFSETFRSVPPCKYGPVPHYIPLWFHPLCLLSRVDVLPPEHPHTLHTLSLLVSSLPGISPSLHHASLTIPSSSFRRICEPLPTPPQIPCPRCRPSLR